MTVNYRVGIFGFLKCRSSRRAARPIEDSGNFALLDIIQALKFVRQQHRRASAAIRDNVTLMGQSAGAINVYALMTSPPVVDARPQALPSRGAAERRAVARDQPAARQHPDAQLREPTASPRATRCCSNW